MDHCSQEALLNNYPGWEPDYSADISGIGVIISFVGTAALAMLLLLFDYVFTHDPYENPFTGQITPERAIRSTSEDMSSTGHWAPNPVDIMLTKWLRKTVFRIRGDWNSAGRVLHECILTMCDVQIITGLAILITIFVTIQTQIASDWFMATYLAWFSAITHLAGLSALRSYTSFTSRARLLRVSLMFILLILLVIAFIPTGFFFWDLGSFNGSGYRICSLPQSPAICYFNLTVAEQLWKADCLYAMTEYTCMDQSSWTFDSYRRRSNVSPILETMGMQSMILAVLLLVVSFLSRCCKLFWALSYTTKKYGHEPARKAARRFIALLIYIIQVAYQQSFHFTSYVLLDFVVVPSVGILSCFRWTGNLCGSMLAEVIWMIIAIAWGLVKLLSIRVVRSQLNPAGLDDWPFGQVIAVVLLASPIFSIFTKIFEIPQCQCQLGRPAAGAQQYQNVDTGYLDRESLVVAGTVPNTAPENDNDSPKEVADNSNDFMSKVAHLEKIIVDRSGTHTVWVDTYIFSISIFWILVAVLAFLETNNQVTAVPWLDPHTSPPSSSLTEFWLTEKGMLWTSLVAQFVVGGLIAGVGIQLDYISSECSQHRGATLGARWAFAIITFGILAVGTIRIGCFPWTNTFDVILLWTLAPTNAIYIVVCLIAHLCRLWKRRVSTRHTSAELAVISMPPASSSHVGRLPTTEHQRAKYTA